MNRHVDDLGRIVIPMDIRKRLNIKTGMICDISVSNGKIILTPVRDNKRKREDIINELNEIQKWLKDKAGYDYYPDLHNIIDYVNNIG